MSRRYAQANEVKVHFKIDAEAAELEVRDDGRGFNVEEVKDKGGRSGFGLAGMEQRASLLDGAFSVTSQTGEGTVVAVSIPTS